MKVKAGQILQAAEFFQPCICHLPAGDCYPKKKWHINHFLQLLIIYIPKEKDELGLNLFRIGTLPNKSSHVFNSHRGSFKLFPGRLDGRLLEWSMEASLPDTEQ